MDYQNEREPKEANQDKYLTFIPDYIELEMKIFLLQQKDISSIMVFDRQIFENANRLLSTEDPFLIHKGLVMLREYVKYSISKFTFPFEKIMPKLIFIAKMQNAPFLIYEAAKILKNIADCRNQVKLIVQNNGLQLFIQLLQSPYLKIAILAAKGISSLISLNPQLKNKAQQNDVIQILIQLIERNQNIKYQYACIWALKMASQEYFYPNGQKQQLKIIDTLCKLIEKCFQSIDQKQKIDQKKLLQHQKFLEYCFKELLATMKICLFSYQYLVETNYIAYFTQLIRDDHEKLQGIVLNIFVEIITNDYFVMPESFNQIFFNLIQRILKLENEKLLIQVTLYHIQIFAFCKRLIVATEENRNHNNEICQQIVFMLKIQSTWIIFHLLEFLIFAINNANQVTFISLFDSGIFDPVKRHLESNSINFTTKYLFLFNAMLNEGIYFKGKLGQDPLKKENIYKCKLEQINGINYIKSLSNHPDQIISKRSIRMLERYEL